MVRNKPSAEREAALREIKRIGLIPERVPRHVAIVMDGNGRWAQARGLPRTEGHAAGESALFDTVEGALDIGLDCLTVYAFSTENWRRPPSEVKYLMRFNEGLLVRRRDELNERGVRMLFSGRRDWRVPKRLLRHMDESMELTKDNKRMDFVVAFNYGGRAEIIDAIREIAAEAEARRISPSRIDEKTVQRHLYHPEIPDPDLVIRTSGELRTSNFLLWEAAYAEYVFTPVLWPDFDRTQLFAAISEYQSRERRFGGVEAKQ